MALGKQIKDFQEKTVRDDNDLILIQDATTQEYLFMVVQNFLANLTTGSNGGSNTGLQSWQLRSSSYSASAGDRLMIDTSAQTWTLNLPVNPAIGSEIDLYGIKGLALNKLTINLQQQKYKGIVARAASYNSLLIPTKLVYINNDLGWVDTANIIIPSGTYRLEILKDSPYTYLRLNESSGVVASDISGNNRQGTYTGSFVYGVPGSIPDDEDKAAQFNGTNTLISFANSLGSPLTYTIECRFKTTALNGSLFGFSNTQLSGGGSFDRELFLASGKLKTNIFNGGSLISPLTYNDGSWHTVTSVLFSGGTELWVDGNLVASSTNANAPNYSGYWHIGYSVTGGYFNGVIDEPSITHSRVSQTQVKARHSATI